MPQFKKQAAAIKDAKVRASVQSMLNDSRFNRLRTPRARRALAMFGAAAVAVSAASWLISDQVSSGYTIIGLTLFFLAWWMLRVSVRLVADAPDETLDERMIAERDRVYLEAYRLVAGAVAVVGIVAMAAFIVSDAGTSGAPSVNLRWGQMMAGLWFLIGVCGIAPSAVMAWRMSQKPEPESAE